jgi:inosine-uridine nucleoside N-ribohydrolase
MGIVSSIICLFGGNVAGMESPPAMASINKAFGRTGIPVGAYHGGVSPGSSNSAWAQPIAAQFGTADDVRSNYPDGVTTLLTALAAAANGSVTYVSTGFLTNLAALLQSFPDSSSPLTGTQLVAAKVAEIVTKPSRLSRTRKARQQGSPSAR